MMQYGSHHPAWTYLPGSSPDPIAIQIGPDCIDGRNRREYRSVIRDESTLLTMKMCVTVSQQLPLEGGQTLLLHQTIKHARENTTRQLIDEKDQA
jgi:hypothetical protein